MVVYRSELVHFLDGGAVRLLGDRAGGGNIDHLLALGVSQHLGDDVAGAGDRTRILFFALQK